MAAVLRVLHSRTAIPFFYANRIPSVSVQECCLFSGKCQTLCFAIMHGVSVEISLNARIISVNWITEAVRRSDQERNNGTLTLMSSA